MKTILVVYTNGRQMSVEEINNRKLQKYCFRTEDNVQAGDILRSPNYSSEMVVTDVIDADYKYYNACTGEITNTVNSTRCYNIKTLIIRENHANAVYAVKLNA